jgi:hypothetical protein
MADDDVVTLVVKVGGSELQGRYRVLENALMIYLNGRAKLIECSPDDDHHALALYWIGQLAGARDRV